MPKKHYKIKKNKNKNKNINKNNNEVHIHLGNHKQHVRRKTIVKKENAPKKRMHKVEEKKERESKINIALFSQRCSRLRGIARFFGERRGNEERDFHDRGARRGRGCGANR